VPVFTSVQSSLLIWDT